MRRLINTKGIWYILRKSGWWAWIIRGGGRSKNLEGPLLIDCLFIIMFSFLYLQNLGEGGHSPLPWLLLPFQHPWLERCDFYASGIIQKSLKCFTSSNRHHANSLPFFTHCRGAINEFSVDLNFNRTEKKLVDPTSVRQHKIHDFFLKYIHQHQIRDTRIKFL